MDAICSQRLRCLTEFSGYLNPRCAAAYNGNLNARRGSRCAAAPMRMRPHARCDQTAAETLRLSGGVKRDYILLRTRDIKEVRRIAAYGRAIIQCLPRRAPLQA